MLEVDGRLVGLREQLADELETRPREAADLAALLRTTNSNLSFALETIADLNGSAAPGDTVEALAELHGGASGAVRDTLEASVSNVAAYRDGARAVVEQLEGLEAVMADLAEESGLPPPDLSGGASGGG
jgi:hypothetical protein